jgi:hypothetical protein
LRLVEVLFVHFPEVSSVFGSSRDCCAVGLAVVVAGVMPFFAIIDGAVGCIVWSARPSSSRKIFVWLRLVYAPCLGDSVHLLLRDVIVVI